MRGWVAISVTAMPAAAPRRIREVLRMIIREPSGLGLRPTTGLDRREPRPCGTPHIVRVGLHRPLWQRPIELRPSLRRARPLPRTAPSHGYPFHPSEQDMISAAGIKDQELTIIVSMMLIKFAPVVAGISISRLILSALRCLARSGSSCSSRCLSSSRLVGARGGRTLKGDAMVILPGLALVSAGVHARPLRSRYWRPRLRASAPWASPENAHIA